MPGIKLFMYQSCTAHQPACKARRNQVLKLLQVVTMAPSRGNNNFYIRPAFQPINEQIRSAPKWVRTVGRVRMQNPIKIKK
ncbi:hypothetical protein B9Z49_08570 [Limnohabitans sp. 2KL-51]|nr:hypothetical protein B9Z49_08570 [Limnohabitans sp. 2KL-51]